MDDNQQDLFGGTEFAPADEGAFEAQLFLAAAAGQKSEPLRTVVKRSGREEKFDPAKVATAIQKAAHRDDLIDEVMAGSLARGVAIYLSRKVTTGPPTAEQVAEAVEQVLFGMGHVRTGLAYARYRDRRGRIRQLQSGDVRAFLGEIEEARDSSTADGAPDVRTGDDQVSPWDRARIVDTLLRETQADQATAEAVATAVDEQVRKSEVQTVTAGLIRELVDAKLIEIGREDLRKRHARLGVPLYDARQLICAPNADETVADHSPESTEALLARRVKRAYAIESVFEGEVAIAHQRGDIHLHGLGTIDRIHSATASATLAHFEAGVAGHASPPRHSLDAGRRLGHWHTFLRAFHGDHVVWHGLETYLAELGSAPPASRQGDVFLRGLTAPGHGVTTPRMCLDIRWPLYVDEYDEAEEDEDDETLESSRVWAQLFAEEAYLSDRHGPAFIFHVSESILRDSDAAAYVGSVVDAAMNNPLVTIALDRDESPEEDRIVVESVAHKVTLNLCRSAIVGKDLDGCIRDLEAKFELAVLGHLQKRAFIDQLVALGPIGPLGSLIELYDGEPLYQADEAVWAIGVTGMNECVEHLTGEALHAGQAAYQACRAILDALHEWAETASKQEGMRFALAQSQEAHVRTRFAHSDARKHGADARRLVKVEGLTQDVTYTSGVQAAAGLSITPMDRLVAESDGQARVGLDACSAVVLPIPEMPLDPVIELLRTAMRRTSIQRLRFA